jgi:hypothetical protein
MMMPRIPALFVYLALASTPLLRGGDVSGYRGFQLGTSLPSVMKQAGVEASSVKVIHESPAIIQELEWQPLQFPGPSPETDPVRRVLFSFYKGELFRILVTYDRYRTEGLTPEDMIKAMAVNYGVASRPVGEEITIASSYSTKMEVVARWEDALNSVNLVSFPDLRSFGMVVFSKRTDALARASIIQSLRLEELEAPQKEIERQKKQADNDRAEQEKSRIANKPGFRP